MAAGVDDRPDISVGLAEAYLRFKKAGVQAELHIYAKTGHGFGIRPERAGQSQPGLAGPADLVPAAAGADQVTERHAKKIHRFARSLDGH